MRTHFFEVSGVSHLIHQTIYGTSLNSTPETVIRRTRCLRLGQESRRIFDAIVPATRLIGPDSECLSAHEKQDMDGETSWWITKPLREGYFNREFMQATFQAVSSLCPSSLCFLESAPDITLSAFKWHGPGEQCFHVPEPPRQPSLPARIGAPILTLSLGRAGACTIYIYMYIYIYIYFVIGDINKKKIYIYIYIYI